MLTETGTKQTNPVTKTMRTEEEQNMGVPKLEPTKWRSKKHDKSPHRRVKG